MTMASRLPTEKLNGFGISQNSHHVVTIHDDYFSIWDVSSFELKLRKPLPTPLKHMFRCFAAVTNDGSRTAICVRPMRYWRDETRSRFGFGPILT